MWASTLNQVHRCTLVVFFIAIGTSGCSPKTQNVAASCASRVSTVYNGAVERSYCTAVSVPGTPAMISGYAKYDARTLGTGGLTSTSLGNPIRYAEIEILDAAGNRVQCGETNDTGYFDLAVPQGSGHLTVRINSRSAKLDTFTTPQVNPRINASVLNCPEENGLYTLTTTVVPTADTDVGTLTAPHNGDVLGAAFNIYDQFVEANEFLSDTNNAGNCGALGCTNFTAAPKVQAYWVKGFNPNAYFGETEDGISFYIPGYSRLFIMGGVNGDVDSSDTDHFDNAIILHEYGHFLEDVYSITNSPGGAHSGGQIDPRLAWSEGWGNFIQAAVRNKGCYTDTEGNNNGSPGYIFNIPLEHHNPMIGNGGCDDSDIDVNFDVATLDGEGNFREFTISRMLWDIFDGNGGANEFGTDDISNAFKEIWAAMTSTTAFREATEEFRSVGLLHEVQQTFGTTPWTNIRATHKQGLGREEYGLPVSPSGSCTYSISQAGSTADLLRRSDFLFYTHPGGNLNLELSYTTTFGAEADIDIRMYNSRARLFRSDRADEVFRAEAVPDGNAGTAETDTTITKNVAAGKYLIQILVLGSSSSSTYDYKVKANGVELCP